VQVFAYVYICASIRSAPNELVVWHRSWILYAWNANTD